ncbi:MAG: MBL fold metallo-hydrolase [bacterium]|nr:MBL fold metallo-hydrolase [bacterium]
MYCKPGIIIIFSLFFLLSCGDSSNGTKTIKNIESNASLSEHTKEFRKDIIKVGKNVHVAIGYSLANSIMIEGDTSTIIVDTTESIESAKAVKKEFEKISKKPVKAIIYTHNHTDHIFGSRAWEDTNPEIYAHETTEFHIKRIVNKLRRIISIRSMRMFGNYLDEKGVVNAGIGPFLSITEKSSLGVILPTKTFSETMDVSISGVRLKLIHAPGETDDQIYVWLPDEKILLCGDNFYKAFPNLYTIRGTKFRSLEQWYKSVDTMRYLEPAHLVPSHSRPLSGSGTIYKILTDYRDAIQFIHDQSIKGINQGLTPDELVEKIKLPEHLAKSPYLQEFYGKVSWSVRSVFSGNLGWFDGNPASLQPLATHEKAKRFADLAGGEENLLNKARTAFGKDDFQWVLVLTDQLLLLDKGNTAAKELRIKALISLGEKDINPNARHYYLTRALELRDGFTAKGKVSGTGAKTVHNFPLDGFFSAMSVHLNADACMDMNKKVTFKFTDTGEIYTIHVRHGVSEIQPRMLKNPDIIAAMNSKIWKEMLAKLRNPVSVFASGKIHMVKGGKMELISFLKLFREVE